MSRRARPGTAPIPTEGRIIGVDLGEVRTGLSVSDPGQTVATAADTLAVAADDEAGLVGDIAQVAADRSAVGVVVGLPRRLDGREGGAAHRARRIAAAINQRTSLPVDVWDERFTTTEAERVMIDQGTRRRARREAVDRVAATFLLQGYLEARRMRGRDGST